MKTLSDSVIEKMVVQCVDNPRHKVGVAVHDSGIGHGTLLRIENLITDL